MNNAKRPSERNPREMAAFLQRLSRETRPAPPTPYSDPGRRPEPATAGLTGGENGRLTATTPISQQLPQNQHSDSVVTTTITTATAATRRSDPSISAQDAGEPAGCPATSSASPSPIPPSSVNRPSSLAISRGLNLTLPLHLRAKPSQGAGEVLRGMSNASVDRRFDAEPGVVA